MENNKLLNLDDVKNYKDKIKKILLNNIDIKNTSINYFIQELPIETLNKIKQEVEENRNNILQKELEKIYKGISKELDKGKFTKKYSSITDIMKQYGTNSKEFKNSVNEFVLPLVDKELKVLETELKFKEADKIYNNSNDIIKNNLVKKIEIDIDTFIEKELIKNIINDINSKNNIERKEIAEKYQNKKLPEVNIDISKESLNEAIKNELKKENYSMSMLDSKAEFVVSVKNIPTETGPINSQKILIKLEGNELKTGIITERSTTNKFLDKEKLINEFLNLARKYKIKIDIDKLLNKSIIPDNLSAYFNTKNIIFKKEILPEIKEIINKKEEEIKKLNYSELNLIEKMNNSIKSFPVKIESNKLISFKEIKEKEFINEKSIEYIKQAFEILKKELPYKEIKNENNSKQIVVAFIDKSKINSPDEIASKINSIIKNNLNYNKSYLDIKKEQEKNKKIIEKGNIKGKSITLKENYPLAIVSKVTRKILRELNKEKEINR